ncbi:phosphate ABC transporter permease subunit PstC [Candidatus Sumerlaeota bacterium]|nr:phosphate ABC transporter permease subunit PstC [Candidatus Sumerlaeota bacterium]
MEIKRKSGRLTGDMIFKGAKSASGAIIVLVLVMIFLILSMQSLPSMRAFGLNFIIKDNWDPVKNDFGAYPFIIGTIVTSFAAIIISLPFSIATSLFIREYAPRFAGKIISHMVDLLAAIPSVIYGMWGIFVLVPIVRRWEMFLYAHFSFIPIFNAPPFGVGLLSAIIILVIMTLPYSISITRDVMAQTPKELKEGALALGSSKWKMVRKVIIPYCRKGIIGGTTLALGRALGETMAVTMVIGNSVSAPRTLFDPANTIASIIANEFNEASGALYVSSLVELGLVLFLISFFINALGRLFIHRTAFNKG